MVVAICLHLPQVLALDMLDSCTQCCHKMSTSSGMLQAGGFVSDVPLPRNVFGSCSYFSCYFDKIPNKKKERSLQDASVGRIF